MKKLFYILTATMIFTTFTACSDKTIEDTPTEEGTQLPSDAISYAVNDFALYTTDENLQPVKFLCMLGLDVSEVEYTDETAKRISEFLNTETLHIKEGDKENPGTTLEKDVIRYISYEGSHDAVINVKGITTTGIVDEEEKCSTVKEVISAYGIDTEKEAYIEGDVREDDSYTIRLNFSTESEDGSVKRIITPTDGDLGSTDARYSIRFNILNDRVHGIEYYMAY